MLMIPEILARRRVRIFFHRRAKRGPLSLCLRRLLQRSKKEWKSSWPQSIANSALTSSISRKSTAERVFGKMWRRSVSEFTRADHPENGRPFRTGEWNTEDISHFGLLVLCSEMSRHVRTMRDRSPEHFDLPFPLFADEGILSACRNRALPNWGDVIDGPEVRFRNSADIAGLQLAVFAAFIINRTQWIAATRNPGPLTPAEEVILRASGTLNILNLTPQVTPVEDFGRESYEKMLSADRVAKGLAARPLSTK